MTDRRKKDVQWTVARDDGTVPTWEHVQVAVLMDIRDELKKLNQLLHCPNAIDIPNILRAIRRNTTKPRKKKVKR